mmetsp:Transcript_8844/g.11567  ORF Transcript_8844/g.11567 Transcript_8844/m.11567 type:complete len:80 (-) Transcript_8844:9-248(-)
MSHYHLGTTPALHHKHPKHAVGVASPVTVTSVRPNQRSALSIWPVGNTGGAGLQRMHEIEWDHATTPPQRDREREKQKL